MVLTRSMSQKNKDAEETIDLTKPKLPDGWGIRKMTLADEALIIYLKEAREGFREKHPTVVLMPREAEKAEIAKFYGMTHSEQAPYFEEARKERAEKAERYRKWKNGDLD